jgi:hypothetical protein
MIELIAFSYAPDVVSIRYAPDICEFCGAHVEVGDFPACGGDPAKHGTRRYRDLTPYEVELDGRMVLIDSMQKADRLEREYAAQGKHIAFRVFHQDASNLDRNTFHSADPRVPFKTTNSRGVPYVTHTGTKEQRREAAEIVKKLGHW